MSIEIRRINARFHDQKGGETMHSKEGIRIPGRMERRGSNRLRSNPFKKMQLRCYPLNP